MEKSNILTDNEDNLDVPVDSGEYKLCNDKIIGDQEKDLVQEPDELIPQNQSVCKDKQEQLSEKDRVDHDESEDNQENFPESDEPECSLETSKIFSPDGSVCDSFQDMAYLSGDEWEVLDEISCNDSPGETSPGNSEKHMSKPNSEMQVDDEEKAENKEFGETSENDKLTKKRSLSEEDDSNWKRLKLCDSPGEADCGEDDSEKDSSTKYDNEKDNSIKCEGEKDNGIKDEDQKDNCFKNENEEDNCVKDEDEKENIDKDETEKKNNEMSSEGDEENSVKDKMSEDEEEKSIKDKKMNEHEEENSIEDKKMREDEEENSINDKKVIEKEEKNSINDEKITEDERKDGTEKTEPADGENQVESECEGPKQLEMLNLNDTENEKADKRVIEDEKDLKCKRPTLDSVIEQNVENECKDKFSNQECRSITNDDDDGKGVENSKETVDNTEIENGEDGKDGIKDILNDKNNEHSELVEMECSTSKNGNTEDSHDHHDGNMSTDENNKSELEKSVESIEDEIIIEEIKSKTVVAPNKNLATELKSSTETSDNEESRCKSPKHLEVTKTDNSTVQNKIVTEDKVDETEIIVITEADILDDANSLEVKESMTIEESESASVNSDGTEATCKTDQDAKTTKTVLLTQKALEDLLKQTVRDYIMKGGKSELRFLKQKCEILEKSVERWRRRALQLQKQINDVALELQKQTGTKHGLRVPTRSVGVNVEISLKPSVNPKTVYVGNRPLATGLQISAKDQQQNTRFADILPKGTSAPPSLTVTAIPAKPKTTPSLLLKTGKPDQKNEKGQLSRPPVPLQLIANSATSGGVPVAYPSNKIVNSVSPSAGTSSAANTTQMVKVIDLTKEDDDASSKAVNILKASSSSASATVVSPSVVMAPSSVPGISIPTTISSFSVPIMSSLPTTLQVIRPTNPITSVAPGAQNRIRLQNSMTMQPIPSGQQVTYLVPRAPSSSSVAVIPRMSGPVSNLTITTPSSRSATMPRQPVPTLYFQRGNTMVPIQSQVTVPATQMASLQSGKTVTITSNPAPPPLQISVANANRAGTSISALGSSHTSDVMLGTPRTMLHPAQSSKHPAPLPPQPTYPSNSLMKALPPKPTLKISKVNNGIVLSWNMVLNPSHAEILSYQLFAYQESNSAPTSSLWKKIGDVRALPLPMACTLTQFVDGHKYHFAVRALDVHSRIGSFSDPASIVLPPK